VADNIKVLAGVGDDDVAPPAATDNIGGVHYQKIKLGWGADGTWNETADSDGVRLPIGGAQLGTLTETAPASDTASSGLNGRLQRIAQRLTSLIALLPTALGAGGGLKVDGSGTALPVSGTVGVSGTVPVSGTFWQATQPVSGSVAATQVGTWTVQPGNTANTTAWKVDGSGVTQPISGTVTANAGTNTSTAALAAATPVDAGDEAATDEAIAGAATGLRLIGFSARETTAAAVAVFNIRHGTSNAGAILVSVSLGPNESAREWYGPDGIAAASGIWLERVSGTIQVTGYSKVVV
jgi:hypothetical protein